MRKYSYLTGLMLLFLFQGANAQEKAQAPETLFDFWVGAWEATWDNGDGTTGKGINHIHKTVDGKVIQENFKITQGQNQGFTGMSISVYNPKQKLWHQAWADNQGSFYNLIGDFEGDKRMFKTKSREIGEGKVLVQRMVFYDIQEDSFTWDWESSMDGGKNWKLGWRIEYVRTKPK